MEKTTERKPVVLCPQKVRNILDGKACEVRIPVEDLPDGVLCKDGSLYVQNANGKLKLLAPPYTAGDILYVKESWKPFAAWSGMICGCKIEYQAGGKVFFDRPYFVPRQKERWRRAANMPECISRAFLNLTGIRAERLWDISEKDAIAEGFYHGWQWHDGASRAETARQAFMWNWDSNLPPSKRMKYSWVTNPYVWVLCVELAYENKTKGP